MSRRFASFVLVLLAAAGAGAQGADTTPDAAAERDPWPRVAQSASGTVTIYQPQVDAWQGNTLSFHAAVSIEAPGAKSTVFGVAFVTARTQVDKEDQLVTLDAFTVTRVRFPSIPDSQSAYLALLRGEVPKAARTISLPRLAASLQIVNDKSRAQSAPVKNAPPAILFSTVPAILVLIDGNPKLGPSPAAGLRRVINTGVLLAYDGELYWLRVFDGWMQATSIAGPWVVGWAPPASLDTLLTWARTQRIDLLTGASADPTEDPPSLWASTVPVITTSTTPAELIVSQGALDYVPIPGTDLLYASNTSARVFEYIDTQQMFVLLSGRWFSAPGTSGPWTYVPGSRLPNDFRDIPLDSPAEPVLASVPGTPQAREAVIDNSIPQTASVSRSATMPAPAIDGAPQMAPIAGTSLSYVLNSPIPIIRTAPGAYYAVYSGVWFAAPAPTGPWTVAASVPTSIYAIPPSSAVYYVTYVQVYGATSSVVYVGYTPGYFGTVVAPGGVVVYGTGYAYPVWIGAAYYPPPMTYGFGAAVAWTPYTGWAVTFGYGYSYGGVAVDMTFGGAYWGAHPYYGPAYYGGYYGAHGYVAAGPGGYYGTTGNVYGHYGTTSYMSNTHGGYNAWTGNGYAQKYGTSYNSATGVAAAGQRTTVSNAYTGNYQSFASGTATNTRTGTTASGYTNTYGNAYSGQQVKTGQAEVSNPSTGQSTHVSGVQTNNATAVKAGNNVYGDVNGNVYKDNGDGSWSKWGGSSGGWSSSSAPSSMNDQSWARNAGASRESSYSGGGWGGRR